MSFLRKLHPFLFPVSLLTWFGLLACTLLYAHPYLLRQTGPQPNWPLLVLQAVFAASVFLHERSMPDRLRGLDFVGLLRRLVLGPGLLATVCVVLHLLQQLVTSSLPETRSILFSVVYTINVGLFVVLLARTNYAWRSLVLFRSSAKLRRQWVWFEVLLGVTLLLHLFARTPTWGFNTAILGALAAFGTYISSHQKWVAYLNRRQKIEAVLLQIAIILAMAAFTAYFFQTQQDPQLIAPPTQHTFLVLNAFFAGFYALMGLMITLFNLPTAGVFEQKREEILSLQRLTQLIQRGQTTEEVYRMFFDSAIQTVEADAAWLDIAGSEEEKPLQYYHLQPEQAQSIRNLLADYR